MPATRLRVLLAYFDTFGQRSGPGSFLNALVRRNPAIEFTAPVAGATVSPFANLRLVACESRPLAGPGDEPGPADWIRPQYRGQAEAIARALPGEWFDVVEVPSNRPLAHFLRESCARHGVGIGSLIGAMHGWESDAFSAGWDGAALQQHTGIFRGEEARAMASADGAYGFSEVCRDQLRDRFGRVMAMIPPSDVIEAPAESGTGAPTGPPELWAVGALGGHKRLDRVVDIMADLPAALRRPVICIGRDVETIEPATTGADHIRARAAARGIEVVLRGERHPWLGEALEKRAVLVMAMQEAFGLAAAEAVLAGLPVVLERSSGLARWLAGRHPDWPVLTFDEADTRALVPALAERLHHYDAWRRDIGAAIARDPPDPPRRDFMFETYAAAKSPVAADVPAVRPVAPLAAIATELAKISEHLGAVRERLEAPSAVADPAPEGLPLRRRVRTGLRRLATPPLWTYQQHRPRRLRYPKRPSRPLPRDPPSFSIVTPSLQQARFISATVESVLAQNYPLLDYRVQDGGSRDGTQEILAGFGDAVLWRSAADGGQAHAINLGFAESRGEIMGWLNSDDVYLPGTFALVARYFHAHPEVDLVYGHRICIDQSGLEIGRCILPEHDARVLRYADYVPQETLFWRRRVWDRLGGLDESFRFAMDWDFILRAQAAGFVFVRLPAFLACFRVHDDQKTAAWITTGQAEMDRLRQTWVGQDYAPGDIRRGIAGYLAKQLALHHLHRLGIMREGLG